MIRGLRALECLLEAIARARCAAAAVGAYTQFASQVAQGVGASMGGFKNLSVGNGLADADVHELTPGV